MTAEGELANAAEAHDDVVQAPQKVKGQENVTGVAEFGGQVVDTHFECLLVAETQPWFRSAAIVKLILGIGGKQVARDMVSGIRGPSRVESHSL